MSLTFTTIQHKFRRKHNLSMAEYALCDMVYFLSTKPSSSVPGWCYMSKASMGQEIGCTKQAILNMINRLISGGFLIKNPDTKYLQTSEKWQKVYDFTIGKESLPEVNEVDSSGKESLPDDGKESLPNNNTIDKTIDKEPDQTGFFDPLLKKSEEIFSEAGIEGVFFSKVQILYSLNPIEVKQLFQSWRKEHSTLGTPFKTKQHLRNSFNAWIKKSRGSGGKQSEKVTRVSGGTMIG